MQHSEQAFCSHFSAASGGQEAVQILRPGRPACSRANSCTQDSILLRPSTLSVCHLVSSRSDLVSGQRVPYHIQPVDSGRRFVSQISRTQLKFSGSPLPSVCHFASSRTDLVSGQRVPSHTPESRFGQLFIFFVASVCHPASSRIGLVSWFLSVCALPRPRGLVWSTGRVRSVQRVPFIPPGGFWSVGGRLWALVSPFLQRPAFRSLGNGVRTAYLPCFIASSSSSRRLSSASHLRRPGP